MIFTAIAILSLIAVSVALGDTNKNNCSTELECELGLTQ
jgi:hypothetical protein